MSLADSFHSLIDDTPIFCFYINLNGSLNILLDEYNFEMCSRLLPLDKQIRIRQIRSAKDRALKLLNSILVQYIVSLYERDYKQLTKLKISYGEFGKPFLLSRDYAYNIADEDGITSLCICFQTKLPIGLDLSNPKDIDRFALSDLRDFYRSEFSDIFSQKEQTDLKMAFARSDGSRETQLEILCQYWAFKESMAKYEGFGLHRGLQVYQFDSPRTLEQLTDVGGVDNSSPFKAVAKLELSEIAPHVYNTCFTLPNSNIIGSIIAKYPSVKIIKLDLGKMVAFINKETVWE
ncbi:hypothetical protein FOA43_003243 [Brettanomyces nanus]|uniref:holo-[acyl-carrier-protein] synthase n=1 Tax=Eeniella nana TaxID=13502 RepID=A0A875S836_EENNA|nr:uncharacterized protein FOA43_003243 [Brettanomyces nanus]QPG75859.1 hypothetical protein FOA43_003243 [Brettanomyces nanus]